MDIMFWLHLFNLLKNVSDFFLALKIREAGRVFFVNIPYYSFRSSEPSFKSLRETEKEAKLPQGGLKP
jgi:hypothetical protein